jgi:hypothetical protein
MMKTPQGQKHYRSARARYLGPIFDEFFKREFPSLFGPVVRAKIAQELLDIVNTHMVETKALQHGQVLWTALDARTRGNSPKRRFVPVVLSLVTEEDVAAREAGQKQSLLLQNIIARIMREAHKQGGILSTRDVALLIQHEYPRTSQLRIEYERLQNVSLPHTGSLHDMGTCVSHKGIILRKIIMEKKDPSVAARECSHSQAAVDRYLRDYYRVRTVHESHPDPEYISIVTGITPYVVKQYLEIIREAEQLQ